MSLLEPQGTSSSELLRRAVVAAALALEEAQDELSRLDSVAGDGDEGLGMARAGRAIRERLGDGEPRDVGQIVDLAAAELSAVGGAMGAISYVIVSSIGETWRARDERRLTAGALAELLAAAEDAVSEFGGAKRGDKSILDPIAYARDAAEEATRHDVGAKDATRAAVVAARKGAAATADMEARVGRASRLGSRSLGSVDAGAQSFAIALAALAEDYVSANPGEA